MKVYFPAESILFVMTTANQRAAKRDGIRIEQELACSIIATRKLPVADPVGSDILNAHYDLFFPCKSVLSLTIYVYLCLLK